MEMLSEFRSEKPKGDSRPDKNKEKAYRECLLHKGFHSMANILIIRERNKNVSMKEQKKITWFPE